MFRWGKNKAKENGSGLADQTCSFCKAERAAVQKLVASPDTAICDRCAPLVIGALEEGGEPDRPGSFPFVVASLGHIVANPEIGEERAVAAGRAAIQLAGGDTGQIRQLAHRASTAERWALALEILAAISDWAVEDAAHASFVHWSRRDYEEGLAVLEGLEPSEAGERALVEVNRAVHRLRLESDIDDAELEEMRLTLELHDRGGFVEKDGLTAAMAECLVRLGRVRRAHQMLTLLAASRALNGLETMLLADATLALGDRAAAIELYLEADRLGGPTQPEVTLRLAKLSPYR